MWRPNHHFSKKKDGQIKKKGFHKKMKGKTNHHSNTTLRGFSGPKKEKGRGGTRTVTHEEDNEGHVS